MCWWWWGERRLREIGRPGERALLLATANSTASLLRDAFSCGEVLQAAAEFRELLTEKGISPDLKWSQARHSLWWMMRSPTVPPFRAFYPGRRCSYAPAPSCPAQAVAELAEDPRFSAVVEADRPTIFREWTEEQEKARSKDRDRSRREDEVVQRRRREQEDMEGRRSRSARLEARDAFTALLEERKTLTAGLSWREARAVLEKDPQARPAGAAPRCAAAFLPLVGAPLNLLVITSFLGPWEAGRSERPRPRRFVRRAQQNPDKQVFRRGCLQHFTLPTSRFIYPIINPVLCNKRLPSS